MPSEVGYEGGCLCGAVRYRVTAQPYYVAVCACSFCQKLTGSDYNVEPMFRPAEFEFEVTAGATKTYTTASEGSGQQIHIHFCPACGKSVFLRPDRFPDCVGVFAGTFDDPNWFPRTPENTGYFFTSEAPRGMLLPAGFDTYPGHAKALDGSMNPAHVLERVEVVTKSKEH